MLKLGIVRGLCVTGGAQIQTPGLLYTNDSEYIRDLIRREQGRGAEFEVVRAALIDGEKSGEAKALRRGLIQAQAPPRAWLSIGFPRWPSAIWEAFGSTRTREAGR